MADDYSQRPYGRNEQHQPYRSGETARGEQNKATQRGSDPLAELARLIGEKDLFAEYGREADEFRRASSPQRSYRASTAAGPSQRVPAAQRSFYNGGHEDGRVSEESRREKPLRAARDDASRREQPPDSLTRERGGYGPKPIQGAYGDRAGDSSMEPSNAEDQDFYDDEERPRRRIGGLIIAGVMGLAVLGTGGAFAYRSFLGSGDTIRQPNVIKANSAPVKVVPANGRSNKLASNRFDEGAQRRDSEKIVSREEQPMGLADRPMTVKDEPSPSTASAVPNDFPPPAPGSGVVAVEPKKVRTIPILPDGSTAAANEAVAAPQESVPRVPISTQAMTSQPGSVVAKRNEPAPVSPIAPRAASSVSANAPLSLNPTVSAGRVVVPTRVASAGAATVSVPTTMNVSVSGYGVQVTSQRSEGEAQAALRSLQAKYPSQLAGKKFVIHKVDLGSKGVYYRAIIGPFAKAVAANELCSGLKAAGGQCIVQKN